MLKDNVCNKLTSNWEPVEHGVPQGSVLKGSKMAEERVTQDIEAALNRIVNTTEQSRNMRKELEKTIYEMVSTLRNLFMTLKVQLEEGKSEETLESELRDAKRYTKIATRSKKRGGQRHLATGGNFQQ